MNKLLQKLADGRCDPEALVQSLGLTAPVNLQAILNQEKIELDRRALFERLGYSGQMNHENGKTTIWVNPRDAAVRQRFTIAHELGHHFLHVPTNGEGVQFSDDAISLNRGGGRDPKEAQANSFAARLLMPTALIKQEAGPILDQLAAGQGATLGEFVAKMALKFEVSEEAMRIRLESLGLLKQPKPRDAEDGVKTGQKTLGAIMQKADS